MLDAARGVQDFIGGVSFEQYMQNRMMQLAVERQLEIIGEAARRVSDGFKNKYPEIPWRRIIGLRNVLAHEYGDIQHERLWLVVTDDLPKLRVTGTIDPTASVRQVTPAIPIVHSCRSMPGYVYTRLTITLTLSLVITA